MWSPLFSASHSQSVKTLPGRLFASMCLRAYVYAFLCMSLDLFASLSIYPKLNFIHQELVGIAQPEDTVAFRSLIVGAATTVAQELDADDDGAQLLLTTEETKCGATVGEV